MYENDLKRVSRLLGCTLRYFRRLCSPALGRGGDFFSRCPNVSFSGHSCYVLQQVQLDGTGQWCLPDLHSAQWHRALWVLPNSRVLTTCPGKAGWCRMANVSLLGRRHFFILPNNRHHNTFLFSNSVLFLSHQWSTGVCGRWVKPCPGSFWPWCYHFAGSTCSLSFSPTPFICNAPSNSRELFSNSKGVGSQKSIKALFGGTTQTYNSNGQRNLDLKASLG